MKRALVWLAVLLVGMVSCSIASAAWFSFGEMYPINWGGSNPQVRVANCTGNASGQPLPNDVDCVLRAGGAPFNPPDGIWCNQGGLSCYASTNLEEALLDGTPDEDPDPDPEQPPDMVAELAKVGIDPASIAKVWTWSFASVITMWGFGYVVGVCVGLIRKA